MNRPVFRGLYAITDSTLTPPGSMLLQVQQALAGGARMLQYRDKSEEFRVRKAQAEALLTLCRQVAVPLIINDDVELARSVGADGVHLGREDPQLESSRRILGPNAIIGVSCYNDFELALRAEQSGADYVAFGRFFASTTKPKAVSASIDLLRRASRELKIPTVAIGGITPENGAALVTAGVDMLAVIQGVFGQPDIRAVCAQFNLLFADTGDAPP
jgi:thiamine-phosphate pyrophosphorylase